MKKWAFTFGSAHITWPGINLEGRYVIIEAETFSEARDKIFEVRKDKWAFQYEVDDDFWKIVDRYSMEEVLIDTLRYNLDQERKFDGPTSIPEIDANSCVWRPDGDRHWKTECKSMWVFMAGGPAENDVSYCPRCGKRVAVR